MVNAAIRRICEAIVECERFIEKEERRNPDLRPANVQQALDRYRQHRNNLLLRLEHERW